MSEQKGGESPWQDELALAIMAASVQVGDVVSLKAGSAPHRKGHRRGVCVSTDELLPEVFARWESLYGGEAGACAGRFAAAGAAWMRPGWQFRAWPVIRLDPSPAVAVAAEWLWNPAAAEVCAAGQADLN